MIIPSIDIQGGRAVQLRRGREFVLDGGDPLDRLDEFRVAVEVAVIDLDAAMGTGSNRELIRKMANRAPIRVGGGIRTIDSARDWLDSGVRKIIIGTAATPDFLRQLPRDRVIAAVDAWKQRVVTDGWQEQTKDHVLDRIDRLSPFAGGFLLTQVEHEGKLDGFDYDLVERAAVAARDARLTAAGGITTPNDIARLDEKGIDAQIGMAIYTERMSLGDAISAPLQKPLKWDSVNNTQLWPTVVVDESDRALGLVWSSKESISRAIAERKGIYYSRSRNEIWEKGASSGSSQSLLRVELDCDRDSIKFTVRQTGGFCHTGSLSCWGDTFGLHTLERTLRSRITQPDSDSGTSKLAARPSLLKSKLVEEATELADAINADDVAHEAADLLYFLLVRAVKSDVSLEDITEVLARRNLKISRRPMTKKTDGGPA